MPAPISFLSPMDTRTLPPSPPCTEKKPLSCGPPPTERYIQLCPHGKLSFERIQRILGLPEIKQRDDGIDALVGTMFDQNHSTGFLGDQICNPDGANIASPLGKYKLVYVPRPTYREIGFNHPGLQLEATWMLRFDTFIGGPKDRDSLRSCLNKMNVWLCPHKAISDPWVLEMTYNVTRPTIHKGQCQMMDPIEKWEALTEANKEVRAFKQACGHCATTIKIRGRGSYASICATRFLGKCDSAEDPIWLAQCGAWTHEPPPSALTTGLSEANRTKMTSRGSEKKSTFLERLLADI